ncbi:WD40 repeat-like protein [Calocera cornea HHB12733]|uniref:WD40 repeat-like protein n=1 Tax=Calocera cornea HHB12733 TaxID=1353952 RepID=A0A165G4P6_9BASI|nr:WD40 repeat-like protein [Calocera cornea HHB12733]
MAAAQEWETSAGWDGDGLSYDVTAPPSLLTTVECRSTAGFPGNFFRAVSWCPDGASLLTSAEDALLRLYTFAPTASYALAHLPLLPPLDLPSPTPITAHLWHPLSTPASPAYSLLLAARSQPVHLLSAHTGHRLASYRIVDHRERFLSPLSLAFEPFSLDATGGGRFWAGHDGALEAFDVSRPGEGTRVPLAGTRKSRTGQRGLISALAFSPQDADALAAGSYARTIALYSVSDPRSAQHMLDVPGGVTQLTWTPDGTKLIAAFRGASASPRDGREIWMWDTRMLAPGHHWALRVPPSPSPASTATAGDQGSQQRLQHSLTPSGRHLLAPSTSGHIHTFDLLSPQLGAPGELGQPGQPYEAVVGGWKAHGDAVGGVAVHPSAAVGLAVSVGGSRWFDDDEEEEEEERPGGAPGLTQPAEERGTARDGNNAEDAEAEADSSSSSSSDAESESESDSDSDSSSSPSIEVLSPPPTRASKAFSYPEVVRHSRPRPRDATLRIWRFPDVGPGAGLAA